MAARPATATSPARSICSRADHDLTGTFTSELAGVNDYRFPSLYGSLHWTQHGFDVWNAGSQFYGGDAQFTYCDQAVRRRRRSRRIASTPRYTDVDLARFTDFEQLRGLRFAGTASRPQPARVAVGPLRRAPRRGHARRSTPPPGVAPMTASLAAARAADAGPRAPRVGAVRAAAAAGAPADRRRADATATAPTRSTIEDGRFATERTLRRRSTARPPRASASRLPFHVTSRDWQESDQVLAGIISDFGSPTGAGAVRRPRRVRRRDDRRRSGARASKGMFTGEDLRAWDTLWGDGSRPHRRREQLRRRDRRRRPRSATRRFAPTACSRSAIRATTAARRSTRASASTRRDRRQPAPRVRHRRLPGVGPAVRRVPPDRRVRAAVRLRRDDDRRRRRVRRAVPEGDRVAALRRHRRPARRHRRSRRAPARVTGAAFVGWDATYSFNADGRRIPVEQLAFARAIRARRCRASRSSPPAAAARSTRRATTSGSASTICSSARKASAR